MIQARNVCAKAKSEILEEHEVTLAQTMATTYLFEVKENMKANLDHTMLFVGQGDSKKNFIHGFGNGGLEKTQGEGATFTAVPLTFNGRIVGSFNVLSSGAAGGALSKQAISKMDDIGLRPGLQLVYNKSNTGVISVLWWTSSSNRWMQSVNMRDFIK